MLYTNLYSTTPMSIYTYSTMPIFIYTLCTAIDRLPQQVALDDLSSMDMLRDYAQHIDISPTLEFIENNFTDDLVCVYDV